MDIIRRLEAHMEAEIRRSPFTDLGDVMERGEVIRRRRRLMAVTIPAAAAVLVIAGLALSRQTQPEENLEAVAEAGAGLSLTEGSLDWTTGPATLGWLQHPAHVADDVMYVLSTAPGTRWEQFPNGDIPEAIYASADGTSWDVHPLGGSWVSSIAASDGLLYAVGTAPGAEENTVTMQVGVSEDGGAGFTTTGMPFGAGGLGSYSTNIMAGADGVLAIGSNRVSTDPWSLLPPEALQGAVEPVTVDSGVAVFPIAAVEDAYEVCFSGNPAACEQLIESEASFFAGWEELGVDAEQVQSGEIVTNVAYWSADGSDFAEVEYPFPEGWFERSVRVGDTAIASLGGPGGTRLFASENARDWREIGAEVAISNVAAIGQVGDEYVMVGQTPDFRSVTAYRAPGLDGPWEHIALEGLLPSVDGGEIWLNSAAVGEGGVAVSLVVATTQGQQSNPLSDLFDRLTGGAGNGEPSPEEMIAAEERAAAEGGIMQTTEALLVSSDLARWQVVPGPVQGSAIDSLLFTPQGTLLAHATDFADGQPSRVQALTTP